MNASKDLDTDFDEVKEAIGRCAFPIKFDESKSELAGLGLSKRELFAAMAMQGLLADSEFTLRPENAAKLFVNYADALIRELNKQGI